MAGMFASAKVVEAKPSKGKKAEKVKVEVEGLHVFAALQAVKKNVEAQIAVFEAGIKGKMMSRFVAEGMRLCSKPESFTGVENGSEASLQLRCRVSTSGLSDEEIELLAEHNVPVSENVAREEAFIINPEYTHNMDMLAKVEEALAGLNLPADFIMKQEKQFKTIATDDSINAVCKIKDEATVAALLPLVTTPAIKATLAEGANPFQIVEEALGTPEEAEEAEAA